MEYEYHILLKEVCTILIEEDKKRYGKQKL